MAAQQTLTAASTSVVRVNLLPPEIDEKRRARRLQAGMGVAAAAAVGVVGMLYVGQVSRLDSAKDELTAAQSEQTRLRSERAKLNNVSATYAKLDAAELLLRDAMGQEIRWSGYVNALSLSIPENVWLEQMTVKQSVDGTPVAGAAAGTTTNPLAVGGIGTVTFKGRAFTHDDIAAWLEMLGKQKGYSNPYFTKSARDENSVRDIVEFESNVTLTKDALSGRYTGKARS